MEFSDVIVIGSGIAALAVAIEASRSKNVRIITKSKLRDSNSYLAQGGIAAVMSEDDATSKHIEDTIMAGRNTNSLQAVKKLAEHAPEAMKALISAGMDFDRNSEGQLILGMEGAHSERRILHSHGDETGKHLIEHYLKKVKETSIEILEDTCAIQLILAEDGACMGVKTRDHEGNIMKHYGSHIVIASGGCGSLFRFTSNSPGVAGDGLTLAFLAGARIRDMEFIQFHPTLLSIDGVTKGLVSEAVRGEGAVLVDESGKRIMEDVHALRDLAPRHIVAQTIYSYLTLGKKVYLDISMISQFRDRFPTVAALCLEHGISIEKGKIPVAPGNHFLMGGIETDHLGRTSVKNLYAAGEAACNGVHGANRLASNSLLEGIIFGTELGKHLGDLKAERCGSMEKSEKFYKAGNLPKLSLLKKNLMQHAGIVRNEQGLLELKSWIESYGMPEVLDISREMLTHEELASVNGLIVSWLICESALLRTESRGGHFRSDYPLENDGVWLTDFISFTKNELLDSLKGTCSYEQIKA
ncbi:L-aspartate oxidase [Bacillus sp. OV322]|uniref:L-aspartate oxidase n=1 Tax=Bacillus sp. OV322 TaxID=1882764 RepID=UPI0008E90E06|nr:L-aspartate oxidase [Bacillus sp. OV322]SFC53832.1 L-aspartate oxidase [Bacillus sp. OV322]